MLHYADNYGLSQTTFVISQYLGDHCPPFKHQIQQKIQKYFRSSYKIYSTCVGNYIILLEQVLQPCFTELTWAWPRWEDVDDDEEVETSDVSDEQVSVVTAASALTTVDNNINNWIAGYKDTNCFFLHTKQKCVFLMFWFLWKDLNLSHQGHLTLTYPRTKDRFFIESHNRKIIFFHLAFQPHLIKYFASVWIKI